MEIEPELNLEVYSEVYSEANSKVSHEGMTPKSERGEIIRLPKETTRLMRDRKLPPKGVDFRGVKVPEVLLQE